MKALDLLEAIGEIDEKYLAEAEGIPLVPLREGDDTGACQSVNGEKTRHLIRKSNPKLRNGLAVAACFLLTIGVVSQGMQGIHPGVATKGIAPMNQIAASAPEMEESARQEVPAKDNSNGIHMANEAKAIAYTTEAVKENKAESNTDVMKNDTLPTVIHFPADGERRMIRVHGVVYVDTKEWNDAGNDCGNPDGEIRLEKTEGIPTEDNQSNFGTGFSWQWGRQENEVEVLIEDRWHIFRALEAEKTEGE